MNQQKVVIAEDLGLSLKEAMEVCERDKVFMLMDACMTMNERYAKQPIVAISMGREGAFSRLAGEFFGSAITFGSDDAASAPGQIDAGVLRDVLSGMHAALSMF